MRIAWRGSIGEDSHRAGDWSTAAYSSSSAPFAALASYWAMRVAAVFLLPGVCIEQREVRVNAATQDSCRGHGEA